MFFQKEKNQLELAKQAAAEAESYLSKIRPLVLNHHQAQAMHYVGIGLSWVIEISWYILGILTIGFSMIMNSVFPFYVLGDVVAKKSLRDMVATPADIDTFHWAVKGLVILIGILFILMGLNRRALRLHRANLQASLHALKSVEKYFQLKKDEADKVIAESAEKVALEAEKKLPPPPLP